MKSILRLYVTTSKGNDPFLYKELLRFNIRPKYDEHLHAFYFDAPLPIMFKVAHRSLVAQNLYVQLGQPFPAISETIFSQRLQKIQFKNYLPLRRGLVQNLTLNILVRQTKYPISDVVMSSLLRSALQKETVKRQYFQQILQRQTRRDALPDYYDMKEIVERKWQQEDFFEEKKQNLIEGPSEPVAHLPGRKSSEIIKRNQNSLQKPEEGGSHELTIPYQPHLTIYVRRNKSRILLKVNQQEMYKLGWKKRVGWAPVRESIATAMISQSGLLQAEGETVIWDPFCGSGTLPLLAAAMRYGALVRMDTSKFNWQHWAIFKEEYLKQYFQAEKAQKESTIGKLRLICSDINFQAANYTLGNLKELASHLQDIKDLKIQKENGEPLVKRIRPTENWGEVMNGEWVVGCGDFQSLAQNVLLKGRKTNIISNLPYLKARSADHIPLSQLQSVYRRFSKMIRTHRDELDNVFILIDNSSENITNPNHFLRISDQKWVLLHSFESGGMPVGLYAWQHNKIQSKHEDLNSLIATLNQEVNHIDTVPEEEFTNALITYRKKVSEIQKKVYFLPKHLLKLKRGWRRVKEKARRRHLISGYEVFSKRRDKMIAFTEYAQKKLEIRMLNRGAIWRRRNMRLLTGIPIQKLQKELKLEFQGKIRQALQKQHEHEQYRKRKALQTNERLGKINRQMTTRDKSPKKDKHTKRASIDRRK